jgi:leader peptidase (prepilin peptidase)/N-methyltransferase
MMHLPDHVTLFFLFILGASFGSFFNVVIYRMPKKMSLIKPGSHCESCKTPIKPYDNIPILSYFILGGKCRNCAAPFSIRCALIEALTAFMTLWLYFIYGINKEFFMYIILTYLAIVITFVDSDHSIIPKTFLLLGIAVMVIGITLDWFPIGSENGVSGGLILTGFLLIMGLNRIFR